VYEISRESLNGFASNSYEGRVWSFARISLKVKVIGQDQQTKAAFSDLSAACLRFVFGKAKFHYASWFEACRRQSPTSFEPDSVMEFGREPASSC